MNYPKLCAIGVIFFWVFTWIIPFLIATQLQKKSPTLIKQEKFLATVPFDRVILYALIAAEQNYSFKKRLLPRVHEDDYYTLILNTAKRLAMADSGRVTLPGLQQATKPDSTKEE